MKIYELTFILNSSLDSNAAEAEIKKITDQITGFQGKLLEVQHLGVKRMTYEINKQRQGNYTTIYYKAESTVPKQLEKSMKHNESILRNLTVALKPSEYKAPSAEPEKGEEPAEKSEVEAES